MQQTTLSAQTLKRLTQERAKVQAAHERGLERDVRTILARMLATLEVKLKAEWLDDYVKPLSQAIVKRGLATSEAMARLTLDGMKGGGGVEKKRDDGGLIDFTMRVMSEWLMIHALEAATSIIGAQKRQAQRILDEAVAEGLGNNETARRIGRELGGGLTRVQAQRIARTETAIAANKGAFEAARSTGIDLVKVWGATEDERTRPTHAEANGQQVDADEKFEVGGVQMDHPGDPTAPASEIINCRCTAIYLPKG